MSSERPAGRAAGDRCEGWREAAWRSRAKCLPPPSLGVPRRVALSIATPRRELSDAVRDLCPASRRHAWQHPRELERAVRTGIPVDVPAPAAGTCTHESCDVTHHDISTGTCTCRHARRIPSRPPRDLHSARFCMVSPTLRFRGYKRVMSRQQRYSVVHTSSPARG